MELVHLVAMRRYTSDPRAECGENKGRVSGNHRLVTCPKCVKTGAWLHEAARLEKACSCRLLKEGLRVSR